MVCLNQTDLAFLFYGLEVSNLALVRVSCTVFKHSSKSSPDHVPIFFKCSTKFFPVELINFSLSVFTFSFSLVLRNLKKSKVCSNKLSELD